MEEKRGRPSRYSPELADAICKRLANGESLLRICRDDGMPAESTVRQWERESYVTKSEANPKYPGFYAKYSCARDQGLDHMAEETIEIADNGMNDFQKDEEGNVVVDHDHIKRSQLRVAARQWYVSKVAPKKYGDRHHVETSQGDSLKPEPPTPREAAQALIKGMETTGGDKNV